MLHATDDLPYSIVLQSRYTRFQSSICIYSIHIPKYFCFLSLFSLISYVGSFWKKYIEKRQRNVEMVHVFKSIKTNEERRVTAPIMLRKLCCLFSFSFFIYPSNNLPPPPIKKTKRLHVRENKIILKCGLNKRILMIEDVYNETETDQFLEKFRFTSQRKTSFLEKFLDLNIIEHAESCT